jgi:methylated-DNA-protein-cysteine methyltransferase-like protein
MANEFYEQVYALVRLIPKGKVCSYGVIAEALGKFGAARQVGYALNKCPNDVPAHRVVNRKGSLSGKLNFGDDNMHKLLEAEGISVKNDQIVNFEQHFWSPIKELEI